MQFENIKFVVVIVKNVINLNLNSIFEILKILNIEFNLLQKNLKTFFDFIIMLNFINNELFLFTRYYFLKDLLRKKTNFI